MNWVKFGLDMTTNGGMHNDFDDAVKQPFKPNTPPSAIPTPKAPELAGSAKPSTPPTTPASPPIQPTQQPQANSEPFSANNILGNFGTPQGFASAAGMMPGVFQAASQMGGMPGIMGIYQALRSVRGGPGSDTWQVLTDPTYKAAAANPWEGAHPEVSPNNPWTAKPNAIPTPASESTQGVTPTELATRITGQVAGYEGMKKGITYGLGRGALKTLPKLSKGGLLPAVGLDALVNSGLETTDAVGVRPEALGGKGETLWWKPQKDSNGTPLYNQNGYTKGNYQFNPAAIGHWYGDNSWEPFDMNRAKEQTSENGKFFGDVSTGNSIADHALSYGVAAANAEQNPLRSLYDLYKFQFYDMNPINDMNVISGGRKYPQSVPGLFTEYMSGTLNTPAKDTQPGGKYFDQEAAIYKSTGRYHPYYNPSGKR